MHIIRRIIQLYRIAFINSLPAMVFLLYTQYYIYLYSAQAGLAFESLHS